MSIGAGRGDLCDGGGPIIDPRLVIRRGRILP